MPQQRKIHAQQLWQEHEEKEPTADPLLRLILDEFDIYDSDIQSAAWRLSEMRRADIDVSVDQARTFILQHIEDRQKTKAGRLHAERLARKQKLSREGVVYYVVHGNLVKIGTTVDLKARISSLSLSLDQVVATEPGGPEMERLRHDQFRPYREKGEWFRLSPQIKEHINSLRAGKSAAAA